MFRRLNLKLRKTELRFKDFILNFNYYLNEITFPQKICNIIVIISS